MKPAINGKKETYDKPRREKPVNRKMKTNDKAGRENSEIQREIQPAINGKKETYDKAGRDKPEPQHETKPAKMVRKKLMIKQEERNL